MSQGRIIKQINAGRVSVWARSSLPEPLESERAFGSGTQIKFGNMTPASDPKTSVAAKKTKKELQSTQTPPGEHRGPALPRVSGEQAIRSASGGGGGSNGITGRRRYKKKTNKGAPRLP